MTRLQEQRIRALHEHIDGLEAELAAARTVTRKVLFAWIGEHWSTHWTEVADYSAVHWTDAERAWLASVVSPPTSGDDQ